MRHRTETLEGALLDAAVAKAIRSQGADLVYAVDEWRPSRDWDFAGPIIHRERIQIGFMGEGHGWQAALNPQALADYCIAWVDGETPLIAAMRAYVASRLGDEVDLP